MAICMYILYDSMFQVKLTARELGFFYQLKETGKTTGFFYLTTWNIHQGKCIKGNKKGMSGWHKQFLYCYDCPEYRKEFNPYPDMPVQTILVGEELKRARKVLRKSSELGDGASLLTKKKLLRLGFCKKLNSRSPGEAHTPVEENPVDVTYKEIGLYSYFYLQAYPPFFCFLFSYKTFSISFTYVIYLISL